MVTRRILAIDIGTSSLKAAVLTGRGTVVAHVRQPLMQSGEHLDQWSAERWHRAMADALPRVLDGGGIDALVLSGNGPTVVPVDESGNVVDPVLLWLDGNEERLAGERSFYLPKIAWFRKNRPEAFARVRTFFAFPEYLAFRLTGEAATASPNDDFTSYIWSPDAIDRYGFPRNLFPDVVPIGTVVGRVRPDRAAELGIPAGTPVVLGGADFLMSLLGTATVAPGRTCDRAGTSEGINHCSDSEIHEEGLRLLPHVVPGLHNVAGILSSTGLLFEWFRSFSGQEGRDYGEMMREIVDEEENTDLPWFFPSIHEGAAWEFRSGMFIGLGAQHSRAEMGRAVVLSIGFAVREAVDFLDAAGAAVTELRACGGQAKNTIWSQMKTDIVGRPMRIPKVVDAELTGNLCAGLVALGEFSDLRSASEETVSFAQTFDPRPALTRRYDEQYHAYRDRYRRFRRALSECER